MDETIFKIIEKYHDEIYDHFQYYLYLRLHLDENEIQEFYDNDYSLWDVDDWILLRDTFPYISFDTAMAITRALATDNGQTLEVMDFMDFKKTVVSDDLLEDAMKFRINYLLKLEA